MHVNEIVDILITGVVLLSVAYICYLLGVANGIHRERMKTMKIVTNLKCDPFIRIEILDQYKETWK